MKTSPGKPQAKASPEKPKAKSLPSEGFSDDPEYLGDRLQMNFYHFPTGITEKNFITNSLTIKYNSLLQKDKQYINTYSQPTVLTLSD